MDQPTLLTIFVALSALAMLIQAGMLIGLFVVSMRLEKEINAVLPQVTELIPKVNGVIAASKVALEETQKHVRDIGTRTTSILDYTKLEIAEIGTRTNAILDVTKGQVNKIDDLLSDAGNRARVQMDRAEMVLDDTITRAHQTVNLVHNGILSPIREVHGVLTGFRAALSYLGRSRRTAVDSVAADEEMFI